MTDHPTAPAGPVQPTPRPEGETAQQCGECLGWHIQDVSRICSRCGLPYGRDDRELARLRAEAAAQTKQIEALTGRLAYCVDLAAHEQQLAEGEEGSDAEHVSGLVRSGDSVGVDRVGADGPPANLLPQGEVARPEGETVAPSAPEKETAKTCDAPAPTETPALPARTYEQGFADGRSAALTTAIREFINGEKPTATDAAWDECARRIANRIRALKPEGETSNA